MHFSSTILALTHILISGFSVAAADLKLDTTNISNQTIALNNSTLAFPVGGKNLNEALV